MFITLFRQVDILSTESIIVLKIEIPINEYNTNNRLRIDTSASLNIDVDKVILN